MLEPVTLLRGWEYLTDDGTIELLPAGKELMKKAHAAGRNVLVEVNDHHSILFEPNGFQSHPARDKESETLRVKRAARS
jgi:hypothetical protein